MPSILAIAPDGPGDNRDGIQVSSITSRCCGHGRMWRVTDDVRADLQTVHDTLAGFGPGGIDRSDDLGTYKETLATCAARLTDLPQPNDVQRRLAEAAELITRAERAVTGRRLNFVTRLLAQGRFAWAVAAARGHVEGALNTLDELGTHA